MVIKKFVRVSNVGKFSKLAPEGDVEFRHLTLLYGENAHGKSTLAGIIRSLRTGDPAYLAERATLGADGGQQVQVLLSTGNVAKFDGKKWSQSVPEIEIFDAVFVRENVFAGDSVENEHRKNLYEIVVGAAGVALRNRIDELDAESRSVATRIRDFEEKIEAVKQAPFTIDDFLALKPDPSVEPKILAATTKLSAVRNSRGILARRNLDRLSMPAPPRRIAQLLLAPTEQVAVGAVDRVREHVQKRLGTGGEGWVRQGLGYGVEPDCPFCGQEAGGAALLRDFATYFSAAYEERVVELQRAANLLEQDFGERAWAQVQKVAVENEATIRTWADLTDLSAATLSLDRLEKSFRHLFQVLNEHLKSKLSNPTRVPEDPTIIEAALQDYEAALEVLRSAGERIVEANERIDGLKRDAASTDATVVEGELRTLRNTQIRHGADVDFLCQSLVALRADRLRLASEKQQAKEQLEQQAGSVLETYEANINRFLAKFGASFRMTGTKPSFPGGKATSTYKIAIKDVPVDLGDSRTQAGKVCFRTALSTGDRSTLALAFFLARLEQDPDLAQKLVVFDDPLSSLDCFRSSCTQQEIRRVASRAAQVVVLSHDPFFLKSMHDEEKTAKTIHIVSRAESHQMKEWDIEAHCASQAQRDYFLLKSFLTEGAPPGVDLTGVASRVRPYVEDYVRRKYPGDFKGLMSLGNCIEKIRDATGTDGVAAFKPRVDELTAINEFGRRFMHGGSAAPSAPGEVELRAYITRAIDLVEGA